MKKTLSVILIAAIMLTLVVFLPTTAEAKKSGDFVYTVTDGKAEITSYLGSESELVIPSDFDGVPVTSIGWDSFKENNYLKSVTIPDTVKTIDGYAFSGCSSLESVNIPNSVTTIGYFSFFSCSSLSSLTIPDSVSVIGSQAFDGTEWYRNQLEGVVYAGKNAYKVKGSCPEQVEIKQGTKGIADNAFSNINTLTSITIPDTVTYIGYGAFSNCKALEDVFIGNSVRSIQDRTFSNCVSLEIITIPSSVTSIGWLAFDDCISLRSVTILNSETEFDYSWVSVNDSKNLTMYGYRNSTAETDANGNNIPFVPLDGEPTTEPTTQVITEPTMQVPTVAPTTPTAKPILGDIDGDGKVTITDATLLQKYAAEIDTPYPIGEPIE